MTQIEVRSSRRRRRLRRHHEQSPALLVRAFCWLLAAVAFVVVSFATFSKPILSSSDNNTTDAEVTRLTDLLAALNKQLGCASSATARATALDKDVYDCALSAAKRTAAKRKVVSHQIAKHARAALERSHQVIGRGRGGPIEYDDIRIFVDHHPALVPLDPNYAPPNDKNSVDIAIPDIAIVGLAKAGTSQLWRLLVSHPDATRFAVDRYGQEVKEFCLPYDWSDLFDEHAWDNETVTTAVDSRNTSNRNRIIQQPTERQVKLQERLWKFYDRHFFGKSAISRRFRREASTHNDKDDKKTLLTVNACYHTWDVEITRHYLLPFAKTKNQKYIVLFRDPADLLWSAYNFWKIPGWDQGDQEGGWADKDLHYRSPEMFHELLLAGNKTKLFHEEVHDYYRMESISGPRKLIGMFGADNVLLLRNEDMLPSVVAKPGGVLDKVSDFTGVRRSEFPRDLYSRVSNCNDKAGMICGESRSSAYHISGDREMLPESRTLVYLHFWEDCKIWAKEFGIEYPDCLNVMDQPGVRPLNYE